jgi:hypothetical protein
MAITINNGVQNILGTPGAISGVFADRPSATGVADGTLYFATDTAAIYQAVAGSWILYTGGGGGGSSTGVNGLNGTTNIGLGGTLANATTILGAGFDLTINNAGKLLMDAAYWNFSNNNAVDTFKSDSVHTFIGCETQAGSGVSFNFDRTNQKIESKFNGVDNGLNLDFANNRYYFGDFNGINGGTEIEIQNDNRQLILVAGGNYTSTQIVLNDLTQFISTRINGNEKGLKLDFANSVYALGDFDNINYNTSFIINDILQQITTNSSRGLEGLRLDFGSENYCLGDWFGVTTNGNALIIDSLNNFIYTRDLNYQKGLLINFGNNIYAFGDYGFSNNNTHFYINDSLQQIGIKSNLGDYNGLKIDFSNSIFMFGDFGITGYALTINPIAATAVLFSSKISLLTGNASGFVAEANETKIGDIDNTQNSTFFGVDDTNTKLIGSANLLTSIGTPTTDRIKIELNGVLYYIVLETA